jgi:hypothetical protein
MWHKSQEHAMAIEKTEPAACTFDDTGISRIMLVFGMRLLNLPWVCFFAHCLGSINLRMIHFDFQKQAKSKQKEDEVDGLRSRSDTNVPRSFFFFTLPHPQQKLAVNPTGDLRSARPPLAARINDSRPDLFWCARI